MNKFLKIISVNLIIFVFLIAAAEFSACKIYSCPFFRWKMVLLHSISADEYFTHLYSGINVENSVHNAFRKDIITKSRKKPILFTGCSFTHGTGLEDQDTISALFSKLTGRSVYNRAGRGFGLNQFLYQAHRGDIYKQMPEPEYIIYTFIYDHLHRMDKFKMAPDDIAFQPAYKIKNGSLIEIKPKFYNYLYSVNCYQYFHTYWLNKIDFKKVKLFFNETEREIHRHWKDSTLVILVFQDGAEDSSIWEELKKENYTVIKTSELTDIDLNKEEYKSDGCHPSKEVWEILAPELIKRLNIL